MTLFFLTIDMIDLRRLRSHDSGTCNTVCQGGSSLFKGVMDCWSGLLTWVLLSLTWSQLITSRLAISEQQLTPRD
jgi:hypothetical protein